jgi:hypothetical protein
MDGRFCTRSQAREYHRFCCAWFEVESLSSLGMDYAKTVVQPIKEVAPRSSIRGFKEDYYHVDADVVVLAGETHLFRKPVSRLPRSLHCRTQTSLVKGAMRFTGPRARTNYASMVVHGIVPPRWVFELGEILASRMREVTEGRLWMGAHMRRGDCEYFLH